MEQSHGFDPARMTILLIDPQDLDRRYFGHRLRTSFPDSTVLESKSGGEGLVVCRSQRIDCVVAEMQLPDMSVFELLVELVPLARHPNIPVIVLSQQNSLPMAQVVLSNGAQGFLVKSRMSGDDLEKAVRKAMAAVGPRKERGTQ
jgi:DNA-binding NarL/FixJ family response regulator